ncbi:AbrB/MazE/SpoVT family DNA-binding domain-containing protein [Virgibacillus salexigens]|uniref:AbrB/MazE/SpoVT family DNA-binding domain-containing protein n=1 Tax=Virgibacillus massiliensis TaxID=1462526 RepID=UPI0013697C3B|nr:AbrB/MazE/SpoVT family DNA-binding domain-containing protein [Virgibacillus massiliensis]MYL43952.1 AbrB/MazE/SpoVT family DNA-binding domain-containing protein [Virgibacillus massiliensis]
MKSTGIVRKVDGLGRIVLPKELRKTLGIKVKDPIETLVDKENIVLRKYEPFNACMVTGEVSPDNITLANGNITLSREVAIKLIEEIESKREVE